MTVILGATPIFFAAIHCRELSNPSGTSKWERYMSSRKNDNGPQKGVYTQKDMLLEISTKKDQAARPH